MTDQFGWYLTLKTLAEAGIFNRHGLTPLESAEQAPLYDALQYLSARHAEHEYLNNLSQQQTK